MPEPHRDLRLVNPDTGEIAPDAPQTLGEALARIDELTDEISGLETEKRSWRTRYQNLKRDKDAEAREHELWPKAVALFIEWQVATGHMRSKWSSDRFFLCMPYLRDDGFALCRAVVWGVAAHPNTKRVTAGYVEVYDDFELAFRNRATFERYARRGVAIFGRDYLSIGTEDSDDGAEHGSAGDGEPNSDSGGQMEAPHGDAELRGRVREAGESAGGPDDPGSRRSPETLSLLDLDQPHGQ